MDSHQCTEFKWNTTLWMLLLTIGKNLKGAYTANGALEIAKYFFLFL